MLRMPNGDMEFPRIGPNPPEDNINGFERDPHNLWLFHLALEPCRYRKENHIRMPCGKLRICTNCTLKEREVTPQYCSDCKEQVP